MSTPSQAPCGVHARSTIDPFHGPGCIILALVIALAALPSFAGGATPASSRHAGCSASHVAVTGSASRRKAIRSVRCLINRERAKRGRRSVRRSLHLRRAATRHTRDMISNSLFSHVGSRGEGLRTRVRRAGYHRRGNRSETAETISWSNDSSVTPERLVAQLMASRRHRGVILDGRYRHVGIGMLRGSPRYRAGQSAVTMTVVVGRLGPR